MILAVLVTVGACTAAPDDTPTTSIAQATAMDRDLLDVTVPRLAQLYADKRYTVR